jgi:hypothetical protein
VLVPAQAFVAKKIETLKEFPPRQKAASFTIDQARRQGWPGARKRGACVRARAVRVRHAWGVRHAAVAGSKVGVREPCSPAVGVPSSS